MFTCSIRLPKAVVENTPAAARTEVFPSPKGSQAKPTRGEMSCQRTGTMPRVMPGSPSNSAPGGAMEIARDCCPDWKLVPRFNGVRGRGWDIPSHSESKAQAPDDSKVILRNSSRAPIVGIAGHWRVLGYSGW